jgi:cell division protein FtsB
MHAKKRWLIAGGVLILVLTFLFSDGVRRTISRRRAIHVAEKELAKLTTEAQQTREKINRLETSSDAYERLVRKELGYLKPGEKEARFVNK